MPVRFRLDRRLLGAFLGMIFIEMLLSFLIICNVVYGLWVLFSVKTAVYLVLHVILMAVFLFRGDTRVCYSVGMQV